MSEPNLSVLAEQMQNLRAEFRDMKKSVAADLKELEEKQNQTSRMASNSQYTVDHMKETFSDIKTSFNQFYSIVNEQNKKIDEFINSDKRRSSNRQLIVSVLQVITGLIIAILGFWAGGKM